MASVVDRAPDGMSAEGGVVNSDATSAAGSVANSDDRSVSHVTILR